MIHEDAIRVGGKTLLPNYAFRVSGGHGFFLEAKKPACRSRGTSATRLVRYLWRKHRVYPKDPWKTLGPTLVLDSEL